MQSEPRKLTAKKAHEIQPGSHILIGDERGGALVRKVYGVGNDAIPSSIYVVWDTCRWCETVSATIPADEIIFFFAPATIPGNDK